MQLHGEDATKTTLQPPPTVPDPYGHPVEPFPNPGHHRGDVISIHSRPEKTRETAKKVKKSGLLTRSSGGLGAHLARWIQGAGFSSPEKPSSLLWLLQLSFAQEKRTTPCY